LPCNSELSGRVRREHRDRERRRRRALSTYGDDPVGEVAVGRDLHAAQDGQVDVRAAPPPPPPHQASQASVIYDNNNK
jgi:hypothetical protein